VGRFLESDVNVKHESYMTATMEVAQQTKPAVDVRVVLRVFREVVLDCPCGGRRVVLAFVNDQKVVMKILEHLGLPTTGPPVAPARRNESPEFRGLEG
jgi:hypothetical protein